MISVIVKNVYLQHRAMLANCHDISEQFDSNSIAKKINEMVNKTAI